MDWNKLNKVLGLSNEGIVQIRDFFWKASRLKIKLLKEDKAICQTLGISEYLAKIIKSDTNAKIVRLPSTRGGVQQSN